MPVSDLSHEQIAQLRLIRSHNLGPISFFQLLDRFGSAIAALDALPELVASTGRKSFKIVSQKEIETEHKTLTQFGAEYLFHDDTEYPNWLTHVENMPPVLMVKGHRELLQLPAVAIVGARNASAASKRFAAEIAAGLAQAGFLVVSGLARGIDTAAHQGVMNAASGIAHTAGIIASGIDISYPPENMKLQQDMAERALVIAEQPPHTEPLARNFPYRNRIIAGMAIGTLVVEAAPKSGSLITARLAAESGREVMAVPGSPLDSRSRGCNELIRNGATLVQNVDDIIEILRPIGAQQMHAAREPVKFARTKADDRWQLSPEKESGPAALTGQSRSERDEINTDSNDLSELLSAAPVSVDELIRQSGKGAGDIQTMLLELELSGRLERHAGGRVSLING